MKSLFSILPQTLKIFPMEQHHFAKQCTEAIGRGSVSSLRDLGQGQWGEGGEGVGERRTEGFQAGQVAWILS